MKKSEMISYKNFRLNKLNTPEFKHLKYLLFWPICGLVFLLIERIWIRDSYFPIHSSLDDLIPFCEYFLIPYLFWFIYYVGIHIYTLLFDIKLFKKMMIFTIVSYTIVLCFYMIFPNCQQLRPIDFQNDNVLTRIMAFYYVFDTNTNVCPSLHVVGSFAVLFAAWKSKHFGSTPWRIAFTVTTILISISTVFLKQHSVIDVVAALPVCAVAYYVAYIRKK